MEKMFFLSGMPRSGSTVLSAILNQNPEIYCSKTSPINDLLLSLNKSFDTLSKIYTYDREVEKEVYLSLINSFYKNIKKKYIIDKSRDWILNINALRSIGIEPKIICTKRNVIDVQKSYKKLAREDLMYLAHEFELMINNVYIRNKKNIHLIDYDDLIDSPQKELDRIYHFLEIENYSHDFNNIDVEIVEENDSLWGIPNLHKIRNTLERNP